MDVIFCPVIGRCEALRIDNFCRAPVAPMGIRKFRALLLLLRGWDVVVAGLSLLLELSPGILGGTPSGRSEPDEFDRI